MGIRKMERKTKIIIISLLPFTVFTVVSLCAHKMSAQTASLQAAPVVSPNPTAQTMGDMPSPYDATIDMAKSTLDTVKWGMTVVLAVVTLIAGITGGVTIYQSKEARKAADAAYARAVVTHEMTLQAKKDIESVLQIASNAEDCADKAKTQFDEISHKFGEVSEKLTGLNEQATSLSMSLGVFKKGDPRFLATLPLIDQYRRNLFAAVDPEKKKQAQWALLEKTSATSPLIRRESVIALAGLEEPSEDIIEKFEEIVAEENDPEIQKLAQEALKAWKSQRKG